MTACTGLIKPAVECDKRAFLQKTAGRAGANAGPGSRDDDYLSIESFHDFLDEDSPSKKVWRCAC
jgi:hypothetical protein